MKVNGKSNLKIPKTEVLSILIVCRLIEPFQTGETMTFTAHAEAGAKLLREHKEKALLVFSG